MIFLEDKAIPREFCNEKRLKCIFVNPDLILTLVNYKDKSDYIKIMKVDNIPNTAILRDIHWDYCRACFVIILFDKSFKELKSGEIIPEINTNYEVIECPIIGGVVLSD